jgi:hypothetical protein
MTKKFVITWVVLVVAAPAALGAPYLAIPDRASHDVNMFDPYDGTFLGALLTVPVVNGSTRISYNAVLGPDGYIYVSDITQDAVFRFTQSGDYVDEFCGPGDGVNGPAGLAFRDGELFVAMGTESVVARFDGPHSRLPDFIDDGSQAYDIHFLPDGRALVSDYAGATDNVRLYNADGSLDRVVLSGLNTPQQLQDDPQAPGAYLLTEISAKRITDFDVDGTIYNQIISPLNNTHGAYRLGNGNLLMTRNTGVYEMYPRDGSIIEQEYGGHAYYIEYVPEPATACLLVLGGLVVLRRRT